MSETNLVNMSKAQAQFLLQCIDTHQKQYGIRVSANCLAMATLIERHFQEVSTQDVPQENEGDKEAA